MIIGWRLSYEDNDSYMLGEETEKVSSPEDRKFYDWRFMLNGQVHPAICPKCGRKVDRDYTNPSFKVRKRRYDLSTTYDGYDIASMKLKSFCEGRGFGGLSFISLPADPDFFWLRVDQVVSFDVSHAKTRFENYCDACSSYCTVIGTKPIKLMSIVSPLPDGLFRTDLEFGSSFGQHALVIAGTETGPVLKRSGLKGIFFEKLES